LHIYPTGGVNQLSKNGNIKCNRIEVHFDADFDRSSFEVYFCLKRTGIEIENNFALIERTSPPKISLL